MLHYILFYFFLHRLHLPNNEMTIMTFLLLLSWPRDVLRAKRSLLSEPHNTIAAPGPLDRLAPKPNRTIRNHFPRGKSGPTPAEMIAPRGNWVKTSRRRRRRRRILSSVESLRRVRGLYIEYVYTTVYQKYF